MRLIAVVAVVLGILLAFGYPAWVDLRPSGEIAHYSLQPTPGAATGPTLDLKNSDAPLAIILEIESIRSSDEMPASLDPNANFSLVLYQDEAELQAQSLQFVFVNPSDRKALDPGQTRQRKPFLVLDPVPAGRFRIEVRRTDDGALPLASATLIIHRNYQPADDRIAPAGFVLLVVGGIGFVLARRRKPQTVEPHPPRENKWGR